MKTRKNNIIVKLLLTMLCVSMILGEFLACEAKAAEGDLTWAQYKADYYLEYSPYEYYMSDEFNIPYRTIVEENSKSAAFNTLLTGWQITTFELSDIKEYSKKRVGYYETFLFDILYQGTDMEVLSSKLNTCVKSTQASTLKKVCAYLKETELAYAKTNLASMTSEDKDKLAEGLQQCDEFKEIFGAISNVSKVLDYATDVEELVYKLAKASVIMGMADEYGDVLIQMANSTSDASMKLACNELASICYGMVSEEELFVILGSEKVIDKLADEALDTLWDEVALNATGYGVAIKAGQAAGKWLSNTFFSTEQQIETYYEMQALYDFEKVLTNVVKTNASKYKSSKTTANAKLFNASFELLMQTYVLGMDIGVQYNEITYMSGAVNTIVSRFNGKAEEYKKYKESCEFIKKRIEFVYTWATKDMYNTYLEECCASFADEISMTKEENTGTKEDIATAVTELKVEVNRTCNMYIDGDYTLARDIETYGSLYLSGGTLDLNGHTLTVHGELLQSGGTLYINGGKLDVSGDYYIAGSRTTADNGTEQVTYSTGYLEMVKESDEVHVGGDFLTYAYYSHDGYLSAGTMYVGGNFRQMYYLSSVNFDATGTHTTILNGEAVQNITFESSSSHFNNLKLTKDKDEGYVFNPDNCWKNLYLDTNVKSVNVLPKDKTITKGTGWKFTAKVYGINKPSQEVVWTVTGAESANTTISQEGLLQVDLHELAQTITVTATSVQDSAFSDSVTVTLEEAVQVVDWIRISPNNVGMRAGDSKLFEATVYGENEPTQEVTWTVTGNTSADTFIDADGILFVGADETAGQIAVTATSVIDTTKSASENVQILKDNYEPDVTPVVEKVFVSPQNADVELGAARIYKATVIGTNGPSQNVTWTVSNNSCPETTIDANGVLTVAEEETADELSVVATSVENGGVAGIARANIVKLSILPTVDKVVLMVTQGEDLTLSARVLGADNPSQVLLWSIEGNQSGETVIDADGTLHVARNEKARNITVTAVSKEDADKTASVQIEIKERLCLHETVEVRDKKESTCAVKGYTGDTYCTECGELTELGEEIILKAHSWNEGKITKESTYTEMGVLTYTCTVCGTVKTSNLSVLQKPEEPQKPEESQKPTTPSDNKDDEKNPSKFTEGNTIKDEETKAEYVVKKDGTLTYQKDNSDSSKVKIPAKIKDNTGKTYPVTEIAENAFANNKKITEIVISENIKTIGKKAFSGCTKLKKVTIGKNVKVIGDNAFANCKALKKITIPSKVTRIGKKAFYGCKNLKKITVKTTKLKKVGKNAFKGIHKKCTIKVPKKKLNAYKKLFKNKGQKKTVKIKK